MRMRKPVKHVFCTILLVGILFLLPKIECKAATQRTNVQTSYEAIILDHANLLSQSETRDLLESMYPITDHGNVAFLSLDTAYANSRTIVKDLCTQLFDGEDAVIFFLNMDVREIYIYSCGDLYDQLTSSLTRSIADNVYRYATKGDYYTCADKAFGQINRVLNGSSIPQPMKYICNALLALILSLFLGFGWMCLLSYRHRPRQAVLLDHNSNRMKASITRTECTDTRILEDDEVLDTADGVYIVLRILLALLGGGGGGRSGGGGSRSGGSRGGGGSHRF